LTLAAEFTHPNDGAEKVHAGAEYTLMSLLTLRGGYKFNYDEEGLTLGAGLNVELSGMKVGIDYAYVDFGRLEQLHMFSFALGML
jgi:opacity protein-like surface antigen